MKRNLFRKTRIATSMSLLLGATMHSAIAQEATADADDNMVEVIEVSGIRGSVIRSMDIKRSSQGIVDAISAEEMGKFPDTNLAESLQRITGVSIDRQNGEGSKVTVRGFGPDYNLVLLNGRHMPASSLEATSASTSRSFDFANIASEGIAGVELYKTGKAHVPTGGMGATINILTTKPLNSPGLKATFGVKGVIDESSDKGDSITPELSALYSNTFADDTFGVAISGSYQKRDSGYAQANTGGWRTYPGTVNGFDWAGGNADWGGLIPDGDAATAYQNYPDPSDIYSVPQSVGYNFHEIERVRTNGQLTLQYRPVDGLTATLDYTYAKNDVDDRYNDVSAWYNFGPSRAEFTDGPVVAPIVYTEAFGEPGDLAMGAGQFSTVNENKSLGLNIEWEVNDNLELVFDIHDSSADSLPNSPYGSNNVIGTATWVRSVTTTNFSGDFPVLDITYPTGQDSIRARDVRVTGSSFRNSQMRSDIQQAQLSGSYTFDRGVIESVDFGVSSSEMKNRSAFSNVQQDNWGGIGEAGDIDPSAFTRETIGDKFDAGASGDPALQHEFFTWDFNTIRAIADQTYGGLGSVGDCGTSFCASSDMTTDRRTKEEINAAYVQMNLSGDLGEMPYRLSVGARYEETDVTSRALVPTYSNIAWAGDNEFTLIGTGTQEFTELTGSYDNFLPAIDFNLDLTDDLMLRASWGKTMARPGYGDIQGGQTLNPLVRINGGSGARGNPGLEPFESTNFDLALEWYYGEGSYASVGYFKKEGVNFVNTGIVQEQTFGLPHPAQGARYDEAVATLGSGATTGEIRQYIIDNYPDTVDANGFILGVPGEDNVATFDISIPVNQDEASTDGWELAVQHLFGESGFGIIANATIVDSDLEYDVTQLEGQGGLLGVSDSANLIGFYDKDGIQMRIAYNWRDKFLASTVNGLGLLNPVFVEEYGQWDINASYDFNKNLTFFVEALNITDEAVRAHERSELQLVSYTETGPRYNIGARYTF
ncbi:TonB-dependent receptor [Alteromonas sp. ASW11-130]|uniref:TonB-dependent receptor n=1 Tax=Alteromonas sp. ASW11-130 TaxID=3015775 RepID=UPI002241D80E|nr:TonB-dependent receptor [Alteromonas sp. ASW11-130]MCW8092962.1 TonB-dependent receptor [Alteromonas sp. ASW11-130]